MNLPRLSLLALLALAGCKSSAGHEGPPQKSYATPDAAVNALVEAAAPDSLASLREVLGPEADEVLETGDPVQQRNDIDHFLDMYEARHELNRNDDGTMILMVGSEEWPFPIPLVQDSKGWHFDTEAGGEEIVNRRIGRNELSAIEVCRAILDAQNEYRELDPERNGAYASKFFSDPGKKNGLYWPAESGAATSPLGELVADASAEGYQRSTTDTPTPFHGYRYRMLTGQGEWGPGGARSYVVDGKLTGGCGVVAWPAEYGNSGIMTLQVNQLGVVYECDLGADTEKIASAMQAFNPDSDWDVCTD